MLNNLLMSRYTAIKVGTLRTQEIWTTYCANADLCCARSRHFATCNVTFYITYMHMHLLTVCTNSMALIYPGLFLYLWSVPANSFLTILIPGPKDHL